MRPSVALSSVVTWTLSLTVLSARLVPPAMLVRRALWTRPQFCTNWNVSFAVHRTTAAVFSSNVFGARIPRPP